MNNKIITLSVFALLAGAHAFAQKVTKKAVDNKGTINTVLDATSTVITSADNGLTVDNTTATNPKVQLGGALTKSTTITTTATNTLKIDGLQASSDAADKIVVATSDGTLKTIDQSATITASNGLTKSGNDIQLGGDLSDDTTIETGTNDFTIDATDGTTTIKGLLASTTPTTDNIIVQDASTKALKTITVSNILSTNETTFTVPATVPASVVITATGASDDTRVWVYRNGVKLVKETDFSVSTDTVTFTAGMRALLVKDDLIEVQWIK